MSAQEFQCAGEIRQARAALAVHGAAAPRYPVASDAQHHPSSSSTSVVEESQHGVPQACSNCRLTP
jgi:hypothetical protein